MALESAGAGRVEPEDRPMPEPGPGQLLIRVHACGVCRTDLHVVDGELPPGPLPIVPGHEIVGTVEGLGPVSTASGLGESGDAAPTRFTRGQRVGVPWLGFACGHCAFCLRGQENLCRAARYTGYQLDGGYAEYVVAEAAFTFPLPEGYSDIEAAPLLCAGLIGHRAYRKAGPGRRLGLYGFGAAAHIVIQVAVWEGRDVCAFVRPGDEAAKQFARSMGAVWAGDSTEAPPEPLDAAILFAPVGALVPAALSHVVPGGIVVCAGIHMSDIPAFPYRLLWEERTVTSVANLTRRDAEELLALAPRVPIRTHVTPYPLADANRALDDLRAGRLTGAAVLVPKPQDIAPRP